MDQLAEMTKQRDAANVAVGCLAADREAFAKMIVQRTAERDQAIGVAQQLKAQVDALEAAHPPKPPRKKRAKKPKQPRLRKV